MLLVSFLIEQGRRNDLTLKRRQIPFKVSRGSPGTSCKRLADNTSHLSSLNIVSERDHCNPLTQLASPFEPQTLIHVAESFVLAP